MDIIRSGNTVEISGITADWKWSDTFNEKQFETGVNINFVQFNPNAATDVCVIKEGSDVGPIIFKAVSGPDSTVPSRAYFYGVKRRPVLDFSAGTFNASASLIIDLIDIW